MWPKNKIKNIKLLGTDSWLTDSTSPSACSAESVTAVLVVEEDGCVLLQLPVSLTEFLKLGSLLCWCLEFWEGHFSSPLSRKNHILSHAQSGHCSSFAENPGAGSASLPPRCPPPKQLWARRNCSVPVPCRSESSMQFCPLLWKGMRH